MSQMERINVGAAPSGAYSHVVRAGDFLFVSGQGPFDPVTHELVVGDIHAQTAATLENVERILQGCGADRTNIVRCGVFLTNAHDFTGMNETYGAFFGDQRPARTTVQAGMVAAGMNVEIDCIAYLPTGSSR